VLLAVALAVPGAASAFIPLSHNTTLVPLPEILTDPNEGTTVGVLATVLQTDDDGTIRRMIAPDVRWNDITGVYPMFRYFDYSMPEQLILLQGGKATTIGEYFEATYRGEHLFHEWLDVRGQLTHEDDPFERFYGFGNQTPDSAETNYTSDSTGFLGGVWVNLPYAVHLGTRTRVRVVRVLNGGVSSLQQLRSDQSLAGTPGIDGQTIVGQRFGARYDTRDDIGIPTEGTLLEVGFEVVDKALASSTSYLRYSIDGRSFVPLGADRRFILASQVVLEYLQHGDQAPFYDRSPLGGEHSLRGFGSNRYIDNNRFYARGELRSNVWEPDWLPQRFNVRGHVEVAPFVDIGRVLDSSRTFPLEDLHVAGGTAFRAVVPPQLVAYVDFGTTGSGVSVFTGIDYPF
jgi:outer membrane protein assembly factor BamA